MFIAVELFPATLVLAGVTDVPPVPVLATAGILLALLPAVLAPPLPRPVPDRTTGPRTDTEEVAA
jgi:energy-coupling factor transport system permease protein